MQALQSDMPIVATQAMAAEPRLPDALPHSVTRELGDMPEVQLLSSANAPLLLPEPAQPQTYAGQEPGQAAALKAVGATPGGAALPQPQPSEATEPKSACGPLLSQQQVHHIVTASAGATARKAGSAGRVRDPPATLSPRKLPRRKARDRKVDRDEFGSDSIQNNRVMQRMKEEEAAAQPMASDHGGALPQASRGTANTGRAADGRSLVNGEMEGQVACAGGSKPNSAGVPQQTKGKRKKLRAKRRSAKQVSCPCHLPSDCEKISMLSVSCDCAHVDDCRVAPQMDAATTLPEQQPPPTAAQDVDASARSPTCCAKQVTLVLTRQAAGSMPYRQEWELWTSHRANIGACCEPPFALQLQALGVQQRMPSQLGLLPTAGGRLGHGPGKSATNVLPAAAASDQALMAVQAAETKAVMEQPEAGAVNGTPPATSVKRELPSRSARGKPRGPDLLAMPSAEYNRLTALRSDTDAARNRSQTAGGSNKQMTAVMRPAEPPAGRPVPVKPGAVQPDLTPAAASAHRPEARAQQKCAAVARTERSRTRRLDGGSSTSCAERDAVAPPGSIAEPRPKAGTADASGAAGLVVDKCVVQGRQRKSPPSVTEPALDSSATEASCQQQAVRARARASHSRAQAATQGTDAGAGGSLEQQPVRAPAHAAPVPPRLPGCGGHEQRTAEVNSSEAQPRADRKRKRRRDDKPAAKSTKRNRARKACTEADAALPVHHGVIARPATGPQLVDSVKLRRRSAPERLPALPSREYNLMHAEQRQEAAVTADPPRQPEKGGQRSRSQIVSHPQPADEKHEKQGRRKKLRKQQAHGRDVQHEDVAAQRGAASGQMPLTVSQRCTAHETGTRTAAAGVSRPPVFQSSMLSQQAQVQMKRSKQRTRGRATPVSTPQWVHL